jgi:enamine deaminase RidA (YjgF/YER057c/UK114 family)
MACPHAADRDILPRCALQMIFISGRGGTAGDGKLPPEFSAQAKNTFEDLKRCLALAGASFKDVVKINYFVTDLSKTTELRQIRASTWNIRRRPLWCRPAWGAVLWWKLKP